MKIEYIIVLVVGSLSIEKKLVEIYKSFRKGDMDNLKVSVLLLSLIVLIMTSLFLI